MVMATAAKITIVQVSEIVEPGEIDPEAVITPGIFADRIVQIAAREPCLHRLRCLPAY